MFTLLSSIPKKLLQKSERILAR